MGDGDQHFFSGAMDTVQNFVKDPFGSIKGKPKIEQSSMGMKSSASRQAMSVDDDKRKAIVHKMESEGLNFYSFLNSLKKSV